MRGERRIHQLGQDLLESLEGTVLVRRDQARVACYIGGEDSSEMSGDRHFVGKSCTSEADIHGFLVKRPVLRGAPRLDCPLSCDNELTSGLSLIDSANAALASSSSPLRPSAAASQ